MEQELFITFNEQWSFPDDSIKGLLMRLDFGEQIPLCKLKEACKKEGKKFKIKLV